LVTAAAARLRDHRGHERRRRPAERAGGAPADAGLGRPPELGVARPGPRRGARPSHAAGPTRAGSRPGPGDGPGVAMAAMAEPVAKATIEREIHGQTVVSRFLATVAAHPDHVALHWKAKEGDRWYSLVFAAYAREVARAMAGLRRLGVGRGDRVVLMM